MSDDQIIEAAVQGHASTRDAIRWAINQVRKQREEKFCETHCSWSDHHADCDQVRVDAEPVAWCWVSNGRPEEKPFYGKGPDQDIIERAAAAEIPRTVQYFYTHPAPAVVAQLVDAVERLREKAKWINDEQAVVPYDEMMEVKAALAAAKEAGL